MQEEHTTQSSVPETHSHHTSSPKNTLGVPIAIVIGALLIGGAIIYTGSARNAGNPVQVGNDAQNEQVTADVEVAPITKKDHIRGNPNAPIMIVEYSDYDCPYCLAFHQTMTNVMAEYGVDGKVAWVYRQQPIAGLHPNAPKIAQASECVAELGGNDAFWSFTDALNASREIQFFPDGRLKSAEPTDITRLSEFAIAGGVDKTEFETCLNSDKHKDAIVKAMEAAQKAGAQGTPFSYFIVGNQQGPINGYVPYSTMKQMIDTALSKLGGV